MDTNRTGSLKPPRTIYISLALRSDLSGRKGASQIAAEGKKSVEAVGVRTFISL